MSSASAKKEFLLLFRHNDDTPDRAPEEMEQVRAKVMAWLRALKARGQFVDTSPLEDEGRVIHRTVTHITDGPYIEAKEVVGGYVIVSAADLDAATAIAREIPFLDRTIVEIRQLRRFPSI